MTHLAGLGDPKLDRRVKVALFNLQMLSDGKASVPPSLPLPGVPQREVCPSCRGAGSEETTEAIMTEYPGASAAHRGRRSHFHPEPAVCPRCRGRGTVIDPHQSRSVQAHHNSEVPAGVTLKKGPPSKDDSLYDYYLHEFAKALKSEDREAVERLVGEAELDHLKFIGKRPRVNLPDDDREARKQVVNDYPGKSPLEVCQAMGGDARLIPWIKQARRDHRREVETGVPLPGWHGWDDERRVAEIRDCRDKGWDQAKTAAKLGVSDRTLRKYWGHAQPRPVHA